MTDFEKMTPAEINALTQRLVFDTSTAGSSPWCMAWRPMRR